MSIELELIFAHRLVNRDEESLRKRSKKRNHGERGTQERKLKTNRVLFFARSDASYGCNLMSNYILGVLL